MPNIRPCRLLSDDVGGHSLAVEEGENEEEEEEKNDDDADDADDADDDEEEEEAKEERKIFSNNSGLLSFDA